MNRYTSPTNDIRKKTTLMQAIRKYKKDKKDLKVLIKAAEIKGNNKEKAFYEEKLKKLQQNRGRQLRRKCRALLFLFLFSISIATTSFAVPTHIHYENVNGIVETIEEEQGVNLRDEDGKIDYGEAAMAIIKKMVADYYNISPSEIDISTSYINTIQPDGSTALKGGEEYGISINLARGDSNIPICSYNSYDPVDSFSRTQTRDTFPKGKTSRKILDFLKRFAKNNKANSFDVTSLNSLDPFDNLPPCLPEKEQPSGTHDER